MYDVTARSFPKDEQYGLTSQIRRAVVSVAANIAEGSGRCTLKQFRAFLYIAQGSLSEVEYYLHLAKRLGYMDGATAVRIESLRAETGKVLAGLIASIDEKIACGCVA